MDVNENLFTAIARGTSEDVIKLLDNGSDVNVRNEDDHTPLMVAIRNGSIDIVKLLIQRGADVSAKESNYLNRTTLEIATQKADKNIIKLLLDHSADFKTDCDCKSLINEEIVNMFIEFGVDVGAMDYDAKASLLFSAAYSGNEKIVQILLDLGVNADTATFDAEGPLIAAARSGNDKVLKILLERGPVVSSQTDDGTTALYEAIKKRSVKSVELLLRHEATREMDAIYEHKTALLAALSADQVQEEIVLLLLDHGADVHAITRPSQQEITEHYLWHGDDELYPLKSDDESTTLHFAAESGNEKIFKMILDRGVSPLAKNCHGGSVLHYAAKGGNEGIVRALFDLGADIHEKDKYDNTFLHFAAFGGNEEIVQFALDSGICVNSTSKIGQTPFHLACEFGSDHIIKLILRKNPDFYTTFTDPSKFNHILREEYPTKAINLAVGNFNRDKCVKLLLDCGINVNEGIENKLYHTAVESALELFGEFKRRYGVEYCEQMKKTTVLEQLLVYGAKADGTRIKKEHKALYGASYRYCVELLISYADDVNSLELLKDLKKFASSANDSTDILDINYCAKTSLQHLVLLGINFADIIEKRDELKSFKVECEREIEKLKSKAFERSTVTYYDFMMTKDQNQLAWYLRNDNIVKVFTSGELKADFPIYALTLKSTFRRGMWRKLMLDRVKRFFYAVADSEGNEGLPKLPFNCVSSILEELSNKDLRMLIQVCDPINGFNVDIDV